MNQHSGSLTDTFRHCQPNLTVDLSLQRLTIDLGQRSYPILTGDALIAHPGTWADLPAATDVVVVTNPTVARLHADALEAVLRQRHARVLRVELPDGEEHKNWATLNLIFDAMLAVPCDRRTLIYALGGGVVGDMAGFAAACYMRGIGFVQVPTTLLAQVDSSVGGKTAINHALGKNMIGSFYQPLLVVCDVGLLSTLPPRELRAGLAEVIKYGPIADPALFDWLELHMDDLLAKDRAALLHAVRRSCEIKARVVQQDEREGGLRVILNFGHTFGHAIESGLGYGQWLHGEAVGCGMVLAATLSARLGLISDALVKRITRLVERSGLPTRAPDLGDAAWLHWMRQDKKAQAGEIQFVLLSAMGQAVVRSAPDDLVLEVIRSRLGPA